MPRLPIPALALSLLLPVASSYADVSGAITFANKYAWRGLLKDEGVVVQGALDYETAGGWYAGALASTVDFGTEYHGDGAQAEIGLYAGRFWDLGADWQAGLQIAHYDYDGDVLGHSADYRELRASWRFRDLLGMELGYAPDAYDAGAATLNWQLDASYPLGAALQLTAGLGYYDAERTVGSDTCYGHLGLAWYHRHGSVDLRYVAASQPDRQAAPYGVHEDAVAAYALDDTVVLSVTFGF